MVSDHPPPADEHANVQDDVGSRAGSPALRKAGPMTVDRSIAKMIAYKRIVTGALSLVFSTIMVAVGIAKHDTPPMLGLAVAIFVVVGAWTLRDGLRLHRELRVTAR